jgi:hypothetical protein
VTGYDPSRVPPQTRVLSFKATKRLSEIVVLKTRLLHALSLTKNSIHAHKKKEKRMHRDNLNSFISFIHHHHCQQHSLHQHLILSTKLPSSYSLFLTLSQTTSLSLIIFFLSLTSYSSLFLDLLPHFMDPQTKPLSFLPFSLSLS